MKLGEFYSECDRLADELAAAKEARYDDPERLEAAMTAINEFRRYWRQIGVAVGERVA